LCKAILGQDSFVVVDSFVLRNRQLLVAANRWQQPYEDSANIKLTARNEQ